MSQFQPLSEAKASSARPTADLSTGPFRAERDAISFLGLLGHMYLCWEPPTEQRVGLNIHAAIIDNIDGEVLSIERNVVPGNHDPLQHAEQRAIKVALDRLHSKRPKDTAMSVEDYIKTRLFYHSGAKPQDYVHRGCTLYTSLEPCPMCSCTLLTCRMKRTVFVVPDLKYGGSWLSLKDTYYPHDDLCFEVLEIAEHDSVDKPSARKDEAEPDSALIEIVANLKSRLLQRIEELRGKGVPDSLMFDYLHSELGDIYAVLQRITAGHLTTQEMQRQKNLRTLHDFQQSCRVNSTV